VRCSRFPQRERRDHQVDGSARLPRRQPPEIDLPQSTSVTILLDALCGGAMMHVLSGPEELRATVAAADEYAQQLVEFLLGPPTWPTARGTSDRPSEDS
jgi:hypothetical protein